MNNLFRDLLKIPILGKKLVKVYYKLRGGERWKCPTTRITIEVNTVKAKVLQIGSNDGVQGDPIRELLLGNRHWQGVFVEPCPETFQLLTRNYGANERFEFENALVMDDGMFPFYVVNPRAITESPHLPSWCLELNSLCRDHILNSPFGKKGHTLMNFRFKGFQLKAC